jgi:hypothetical protein
MATRLMSDAVPIFSLIVAAIAVFVGPMVSWHIAKRQARTSLSVANKQIVAPMRQAWINNLRDILADLLSSTLHYYVAGYENRKDEEYQRVTLLEHKTKLMLNANEEDHRKLEALVRELIEVLDSGPRDRDRSFEEIHSQVTQVSRQILKREWNRVTEVIQ